jgi:hypothetical protein
MTIAHMAQRPGELKREITPKWAMGFTSIAGSVDLDMLHIFAI